MISLQFQGVIQQFLHNSAAFCNVQIGGLRHILSLHSIGITPVELRCLLAQTGVTQAIGDGREMNIFYTVKDLQSSIYATQYCTYFVEHVDLKLECTSHQVSFRQCVSAPWQCNLRKIMWEPIPRGLIYGSLKCLFEVTPMIQ